MLKYDGLADLVFGNDQLAKFLAHCLAPGTPVDIMKVANGFGHLITNHADVIIND